MNVERCVLSAIRLCRTRWHNNMSYSLSWRFWAAVTNRHGCYLPLIFGHCFCTSLIFEKKNISCSSFVSGGLRRQHTITKKHVTIFSKTFLYVSEKKGPWAKCCLNATIASFSDCHRILTGDGMWDPKRLEILLHAALSSDVAPSDFNLFRRSERKGRWMVLIKRQTVLLDRDRQNFM